MESVIKLVGEVDLQASADGKPPKISGLAYCGGGMRIPGYSLPVFVDLAGCVIPESFPLLVDHAATLDTVVGMAQPRVRDGQLFIEGTLADNEAAQKIVKAVREGVKFQLSIGAMINEQPKHHSVGDVVTVNGRKLTVPSPGIYVAASTRLREVSIVVLGADAGTSCTISAKKDLSTMTAENNVLDIQAERTRISEINATIDGLAGSGIPADKLNMLRATATAEGTSVSDVRAELLTMLRASRPSVPFIASGNTSHIGSPQISAAILVRAGLSNVADKAYGPRVLEESRSLHSASMVDICRAALATSGPFVPHDRNEMIRAAMSNVVMTTALGDAANKALETAYRESNQSWRAFAAIRPAADFKTQYAIRPSFIGSLAPLAKGGDIQHGTIEESVFSWSVDTFAKMYSITRKDLINDDLSAFSETPTVLGTAAARKVADLVYTTLLANGGNFFAAGNNNLATGAGSALQASSLGDAIAKMRKQRDAEGNDLSIAPRVLLVPPELEVTARQLLESTDVNRTGDQAPRGNALQGSAALAVESRLSNTGKFSNGSTTAWYLFGGPQDVPFVVGFLDGQETPRVEFFGLDSDPSTLAVSWRVYHDFGAALGDFRAAVKANGA